MKRIYILHNSKNDLTATMYGVGTYIRQLKQCLLSVQYHCTVVNLYADVNEISIDKNKVYDEIFIPFKGYDQRTLKHYWSSIPFILYDFIPDDFSGDLIFHMHSMEYSSLAHNLKKVYKKCKVVLTIHYMEWSFRLLGDIDELFGIINSDSGSIDDPFQKEMIRLVEEDGRLINECDKLICIAEHSADTIKKIYKSEKMDVIVINNGLSDDFIELSSDSKSEIRKKYHIRDDVFIVLFAGRLHDVKGISHLLRAYRHAMTKSNKLHLLLAGKGNFEKWITESSGFGSRVSFLGHVNKEMLYELYQIADIGVVSSLHEEFGYVAIEMMMHKVPIIVNNTTGLKEIVKHKQSGLIYNFTHADEEKGVNELAEALLFYLNNPKYASDLGENGRRRFLDHYSLPVFKEKMLDFYKAI